MSTANLLARTNRKKAKLVKVPKVCVVERPPGVCMWTSVAESVCPEVPDGKMGDLSEGSWARTSCIHATMHGAFQHWLAGWLLLGVLFCPALLQYKNPSCKSAWFPHCPLIVGPMAILPYTSPGLMNPPYHMLRPTPQLTQNDIPSPGKVKVFRNRCASIAAQHDCRL